jgi:hypothetical protein
MVFDAMFGAGGTRPIADDGGESGQEVADRRNDEGKCSNETRWKVGGGGNGGPDGFESGGVQDLAAVRIN